MIKKLSDKDKKDWEKFISSKEQLPNKDLKFSKINKKKIRSLDLHGYTLEEANKNIKIFIDKCFSDGINKLIIVTGKGLHSQNDSDPYVSKDLSILKYSVPEFIKNSEDLMNKINYFEDADIKDGGEGAFYLYLKKK